MTSLWIYAAATQLRSVRDARRGWKFLAKFTARSTRASYSGPMKWLLAILAILAAVAPAAAQPIPLSGVSDEETDIPSGEIKTYFRGKGDVIFVQHQTDRWYRVRLNDGCLNNLVRSDSLVFERKIPGAGIDRFSRVSMPTTGISCSIRSIRRSAPPPQVDSDSPVTLD